MRPLFGELLGNAKRLLESLWAIQKGYRKAREQCPNTRHQPIGEKRRQNYAAAFCKNIAISVHFLSSYAFLLKLINNQRHI
jgi:hypothetical protein